LPHAVSCGFETVPHAVILWILSVWLLALISKIKIRWQQGALMKSGERSHLLNSIKNSHV